MNREMQTSNNLKKLGEEILRNRNVIGGYVWGQGDEYFFWYDWDFKDIVDEDKEPVKVPYIQIPLSIFYRHCDEIMEASKKGLHSLGECFLSLSSFYKSC